MLRRTDIEARARVLWGDDATIMPGGANWIVTVPGITGHSAHALTPQGQVACRHPDCELRARDVDFANRRLGLRKPLQPRLGMPDVVEVWSGGTVIGYVTGVEKGVEITPVPGVDLAVEGDGPQRLTLRFTLSPYLPKGA